jgi:hypothetical protein
VGAKVRDGTEAACSDRPYILHLAYNPARLAGPAFPLAWSSYSSELTLT